MLMIAIFIVTFKLSLQEYLTTEKILKSCGQYLITILIEVERNTLEPFRFNVIENKPLKSDNDLNLHFSDEDICQRSGKSLNNDPKDLPIEQAQENSTKASEKSSERPLEKTHQDLKVKPVKLLKFIYSEKAKKFCEIFTLLLSYVVPVKSKVKIFWSSQNR